MRHISLASILAAALLAPCAAQPRFDFDRTPGLLSKQVLPVRYRLTLDVDPARATFTGQASIEVDVRAPVAEIVLHAKDLTPSRSVLVGGAAGTRTLKVVRQRDSETWRLVPTDAAPIPAGAHRLEIRYRGAVQQTGEGLYMAPYAAGGKPMRMLGTQMEAVHARQVFPAFDEPSFRVAYELTVRAPKGYGVASNMPVQEERAVAGAIVHRFAPTPPMPSYLVSLAVGRFDALAGDTQGVPLRILTARGKREQARYAMQVTQQVMPYYQEYFGQRYALPKLDQIAMPSVREGAMEDWGLISYAENTILFEPARSGSETRRTVFHVVAHEISHQWFGNLVTAASWDEIWLNEAFATWMENKMAARFNPEWQEPLHLRVRIDRTMERDAGPSTRAIRSGPVSERQVFDVFDSITYSKGGAVLSMLEQWVGPEAFQRGLAAYMAERRLSNATAGDLWHHIGAAAGRDVTAVATSWTDQPGFPVVQVAVACEANRTRVSLSQSRFSIDDALAPLQWKIPVRLARGPDEVVLLLDAPEGSAHFDGCSDEPVIVNAGGTGYYRVAYDAESLRRLAARFVNLAPADRVTLLSDTFALAQAGRAPMASYFSLLASIGQVQDAGRPALFSMAGAGLRFLDSAMAGTPALPRVRAAARALLAPELARVGWTPRPGEDDETQALRATLIERLARFDDASAIEQARRLFDAAGHAPLPASTRAAVIQAVGMHANPAHFDRLLAHLRAASGEEDRWVYATALAAGRHPGRAEKLMAASLNGIAPANIASAIPGVVGSESPFGEQAYRFTLANFAKLSALAGTGAFGGKVWLLPNAAWQFNDATLAARLVRDQQRELGNAGESAAARGAARIALLAAVKRREAEALDQALAGWNPKASRSP